MSEATNGIQKTKWFVGLKTPAVRTSDYVREALEKLKINVWPAVSTTVFRAMRMPVTGGEGSQIDQFQGFVKLVTAMRMFPLIKGRWISVSLPRVEELTRVDFFSLDPQTVYDQYYNPLKDHLDLRMILYSQKYSG